MDLDLRLVRAFVEVANHWSFSQAAETLHVSQPALSQQVRQLERILGVQLFERTSRRVDLTHAGELFFDDAEHLLSEAERAVVWLRRAANMSGPSVRVGFVAGTPASLLTSLIHLADAELPGTLVELASIAWASQADSLTDQLVDLAFVQAPLPSNRVVLAPLVDVARVAAFHSDHPLAQRSSLSIADLADVAILDARYNRDFWLVLPRPDGRTPEIVPASTGSVEEMLAVVAAGKGMAITVASLATTHRRDDVAFVPIDDIEPVTLSFARLDQLKPDSPARELFDLAATELAGLVP
jgi:DNA-binding transcriptional LysR family regulator